MKIQVAIVVMLCMREFWNNNTQPFYQVVSAAVRRTNKRAVVSDAAGLRTYAGTLTAALQPSRSTELGWVMFQVHRCEVLLRSFLGAAGFEKILQLV